MQSAIFHSDAEINSSEQVTCRFSIRSVVNVILTPSDILNVYFHMRKNRNKSHNTELNAAAKEKKTFDLFMSLRVCTFRFSFFLVVKFCYSFLVR